MNERELTPYLIRSRYELGWFPMTLEDGSVEWFKPYRRCLFRIEGMHVSRSLAKVLRKGDFDVRFDTSYEKVMRACLRPDGNWISEDFIRVYTQIHREGWGHCCEVWREDRLIGGVYGVALGAAFCAESMFHTETNGSKIALHHLIAKCRDLGFTLFDAQFTNPHLASLGSYEVGHETYWNLLRAALKKGSPWDRYRK